MSGVYQLPGLFLTALCHAVVICHIAEHRYSRKKFVLYSCIFTVVFVCLMGYGYAAGGWGAFFPYMGIAVEVFLYSCIVSK
ncbi:MAG: hypothetical protein K2N85_01470, partial [Lachnospiraceae bacterium]|nr:hypothetical protein [Lachnospiraceae bacterium]